MSGHIEPQVDTSPIEIPAAAGGHERRFAVSAREPTVAILFCRIGPYHYARLRVAAQRCRLAALELFGRDQTYSWAAVSGVAGFDRDTLFWDADVNTESAWAVSQRAFQVLDKVNPDAVVIPGWSEPGALAALRWCLRMKRPAVLMSDSAADDEPRRWFREIAKRRIVRLCSAAIVGGAPHREYVQSLGLPGNSVTEGYDVVDNQFFADGAEATRFSGARLRERFRLPEYFFLASSRFLKKKNLFSLLEAYARYRRCVAPNHWRLVLLGDGRLREGILCHIAALSISEDVILPGFKQYEELPIYYGLAGAFVHASTTEQWGLVVNEAMASGLPVIVSERCGCAPDLIRNGVNGYTFSPYNVEELASLMLKIASDKCDRDAMGQASRRIINDWGLGRFADGLMMSVELALSRPVPKASRIDKAVLWTLIHRPRRFVGSPRVGSSLSEGR